MMRLYILLCLLPCLLLTTSFTHAALLPRLKASFKLSGVVFNEPVTRSIKVMPFKKSSGKSHHSHGVHHTLSLVKRMVEDQGDMVEVTEEALQELLDQINRLHEQVNNMIPSGAPNEQPSRETSASSGGQSPGGSPDESSSGEQLEQVPSPSTQAEGPEPHDAYGPSEVPIVSDPSLRSPLPSQADADTVIEPKAPGAPGEQDASQTEQANRQENTELALPTAPPTQAANGESANLLSNTQPEKLPADDVAGALTESADTSEKADVIRSGDLPNNAVAQPTGKAQASTGTQLNTAQQVKPTEGPEEPKDRKSLSIFSGQGTEDTSVVPGGAFVENPDDATQTLSDDASSIGQTASSALEQTQGPFKADEDDECPDEVSGLPISHRNPNCTPGSSPSAREPSQDTTVIISVFPTPEGDPSQQQAAKEPPAATVEEVAPALETEATLNPTTKAGGSQKLAAPTLLSSPAASSRPEPLNTAQGSVSQTSPILRTLVFTSFLARSSTIRATTTRTEFVDANQPTRSLKAPGHVFKEDAGAGADVDSNGAFNKNGKLAQEDDGRQQSTQETPPGRTPAVMEPTPIQTTTTATISLSRVSIMSTPEPTQEYSPRSPVSSGTGNINGLEALK
ncbi:hypothetical protein F53441_7889 [Fusarium austroafricanum]|uniref:Uncharacterized protein n=1 Tax=Fusarium austroafricanum TaxID=2364996 RepID=A0A8H4NXY2_9HYPO|nr:hypothetical protein F53441_7889 [Fusarium austroafricanum]